MHKVSITCRSRTHTSMQISNTLLQCHNNSSHNLDRFSPLIVFVDLSSVIFRESTMKKIELQNDTNLNQLETQNTKNSNLRKLRLTKETRNMCKIQSYEMTPGIFGLTLTFDV